MLTAHNQPTDPIPRRPPAVEVSVCEDLDAWSSERVHHAMQQALSTRPQLLIIDLGECPSMDDAGVALVLDTHRRAAQIGVTVALRSPSAWLRITLERAHGQVLQVVDTTGQSVAATAPGRHRVDATS